MKFISDVLGVDEDENEESDAEVNAISALTHGKIIVGYDYNYSLSANIAFKHQSGEASDEMINVFGSYGYVNLLGKKSQIINAKIGTEVNRFGGVVNIGKDETSKADVILNNNVYADTLAINKDSKLNIKLSNIAAGQKISVNNLILKKGSIINLDYSNISNIGSSYDIMVDVDGG